jgi:hypothetical protein
MGQTIELSDESVALLKRQAEAHGLSVDAWVLALAREKADVDGVQPSRQRAQAAAARIREIQKRVKPDPEGWTIRDYINHGRP